LNLVFPLCISAGFSARLSQWRQTALFADFSVLRMAVFGVQNALIFTSDHALVSLALHRIQAAENMLGHAHVHGAQNSNRRPATSSTLPKPTAWFLMLSLLPPYRMFRLKL
jgi:hypothetical protein